jgi:hypothetical protein
MAIKRLANMGVKFDAVDRMTGTTPIMEIVKQVLLLYVGLVVGQSVVVGYVGLGGWSVGGGWEVCGWYA